MEANPSPVSPWQGPGNAPGSGNAQGPVGPNNPGFMPNPPGYLPAPPPAADYPSGEYSSAEYMAAPPGFPSAPASAYDPYVPPSQPGFGMPVPNEPAKKKSKGVLIGSVAAVVALGAGAVFFVASATSRNSGGAASPEALANQFLDAVDHEDVLGVVDTLLPGERDVARQPLIDYVNELTRLQILAPVDLNSIKGVDITVLDRNIVAEPTNVPDITNVSLSGNMTVAWNGGEAPIGKIIQDNVPSADLDEMRNTSDTQDQTFDYQITTVQQDGRWYFSLGYSAAESMRAGAGSPDIPATGIGATGSDSPEAAFNLVLDRIAAIDPEGLLMTLNPGEAGALQRYAPLFIGEANGAADELKSEGSVSLQFSDVQLHSKVDGDHAQVFLDSIAISGEADGSAINVTWNGECIHGDIDGSAVDECSQSFNAGDMAVFTDMFPDLGKFLEDLSASFSDMQNVGIGFQRTGGQWYFSPIGTVTDATLAVLRALDVTELQTLIDDIQEVGTSLDSDMTTIMDDMNLGSGTSDYSDYSDVSDFTDYSDFSDFSDYSDTADESLTATSDSSTG